MKIAVVTVQRVTNYGALLQAFASKEILSKYGDVEIIDYDNRYLTSHMDLIRFKWSKRGIKMLVHDILNFKNRKRLLKNFKDFIRNHLNLTKSATREDLLGKEFQDYDYYVSGSDQIWNPSIVNADGKIDEVYFLAFAASNAKKVSLSSSMGGYTFTQEESKSIKRLLEAYSAISVRENEGADYLNKLFPEKKIAKTLDPTLLLTESDWKKLADGKDPVIQGGYILVYSVPRTALLRKAITYFSKKFRMPVVAIDKMFNAMTDVDYSLRDMGPGEYISLFLNASFIITDSFHGTCFSVNFKKPFVCIPATKGANRQEGFLKALGLMSRLVYEESEFDTITQDLDFSGPAEKLSKLRAQSLGFLERAMS